MRRQDHYCSGSGNGGGIASLGSFTLSAMSVALAHSTKQHGQHGAQSLRLRIYVLALSEWNRIEVSRKVAVVRQLIHRRERDDQKSPELRWRFLPRTLRDIRSNGCTRPLHLRSEPGFVSTHVPSAANHA